MSDSDDDDFLADFSGIGEYEAASPNPREYKPWHRPRKQYIREKQWCASIAEILPEWTSNSSTLKYLTLPGEDLLDIRLIHDRICNSSNVNIQFIGFDTSAAPDSANQTDFNTSLHETYRLEHIDRNSTVLPDDILLVGDPKSIAYQRVDASGPYHAINLDFCNGFAQNPVHPHSLPTVYDLLGAILDIQSRGPSRSLLFMTFRTNRASNSEKAIEKLFELAQSRFTDCQPYQRAVLRYFDVNNVAEFESSLLQDETFESTFLLSTFTYLLDAAFASNIELTLTDIVNYKVYPESPRPDMASIVITIRPFRNNVPDPNGLRNNRFIVASPSLCSLSRDLVYPTSNRRNVDTILADDDELREQMITGTMELLAQARYEVGDYRAWACQQN